MKKRPTSVSFICKTTHGNRMLIFALICSYKHDFVKKNACHNVVQFLRYNRSKKYKFRRQSANHLRPLQESLWIIFFLFSSAFLIWGLTNGPPWLEKETLVHEALAPSHSPLGQRPSPHTIKGTKSIFVGLADILQ